MKNEITEYEYQADKLQQDIAQKENAEYIKNYAKNKLGMSEGERENTVFVDLMIEDKTTVVQSDEKEGNWTFLLSSVGKLFADLFD